MTLARRRGRRSAGRMPIAPVRRWGSATAKQKRSEVAPPPHTSNGCSAGPRNILALDQHRPGVGLDGRGALEPGVNQEGHQASAPRRRRRAVPIGRPTRSNTCPHPEGWTRDCPILPAETDARLHKGLELHFRPWGRRQLTYSWVKISVRRETTDLSKMVQNWPSSPQIGQDCPQTGKLCSNLAKLSESIGFGQMLTDELRNSPTKNMKPD